MKTRNETACESKRPVLSIKDDFSRKCCSLSGIEATPRVTPLGWSELIQTPRAERAKATMIHLTDAAIQEIKRLMSEKELEGAMLRFGVEAGGCSGLQYSMDFAEEAGEGDHVFEHGDLKVICDEKSLAYLNGLEVDFSDKLMGGGFKFHNPQAVRSCGCGTSFRV